MFIFFVIFIIIMIIFLISLILIYNNLISLRNNIDKAWANIDVLLKQRSNEIPNLVNTVKAYMKHERKTLESLTRIRSYVLETKTLSRKAAADNFITDLIKTVFAVAEQYPDLKAGENFLKLQRRITGLENELADRREFYNDSVTIYNTRIQSFPDLIMAKVIHLNRVELFEATEEDKKYLNVNF